MKKADRIELGVEIMAAMKAVSSTLDMDQARDLVLLGTSVDRQVYITREEFDSIDDEDQKTWLIEMSKRNRLRMEVQALAVADIVIRKIKTYEL